MKAKCKAAILASAKFKAECMRKVKIMHAPDVKEKAAEGRRSSAKFSEWMKEIRVRFQNSPNTKPGQENIHGREWHVRSPENVSYSFVNLQEFVRTNAELFDPRHLARAAPGISCLRPSENRKRTWYSWRGWTWDSDAAWRNSPVEGAVGLEASNRERKGYNAQDQAAGSAAKKRIIPATSSGSP